MTGVRACQRSCPEPTTCSTRSVFTGRVTLQIQSSQLHVARNSLSCLEYKYVSIAEVTITLLQARLALTVKQRWFSYLYPWFS
jgi:hypothetical protein